MLDKTRFTTLLKAAYRSGLVLSKVMVHTKARSTEYPRSKINRFPVPDALVPWSVEYKNYGPVEYTAPSVLSMPVWADQEIRNVQSPVVYKFNQIDGKIDRRSFSGEYQIVNGVPRNPSGRTGVEGRGLLGKWGPNHAADPIVTRWKKEKGKGLLGGSRTLIKNDKPVLEFVAIQRKDTGEWALPGGMVDTGETAPQTLMREFGEEALNSLDASKKEKEKIMRKVSGIFRKGIEIYKGYVDDPRNTDNAWMETVAINFHDEKDRAFNKIQLKAGDDAIDVQWMEINGESKLYASHLDFLKVVCEMRGAYF